MEKWIPLRTWPNHKYLISDQGRIKSTYPSKSQLTLGHLYLAQHKTKFGSIIVNLYDGKTSAKTKYLTQLMKIFLPPKPFPNAQVYHLNGDRSDNRVSNLGWRTQSEIILDGIKTGRRPRSHPHRKLTYLEMKIIEKLHHKGWSQVKIGKEIGRNNSTVSKFLSRATIS